MYRQQLQQSDGCLRYFAGEKADIYSAGVEPHGVNFYAIAVMKEDGIDISSHTFNHISEYRHIDFDIVITVCDRVKESCPVFPSNAKMFHHSFPDPAKALGTEDEIMQQFIVLRDQIKRYCADFMKNECIML